MSLVRYQPHFGNWNSLDQFRKEINQFFNPDNELDPNASSSSSVVTSDWTPSVDVKETKDEFILHADIPGVDPKDIDVHMENGLLTIKGQRHSEKTDENKGYTRVERSFGQFYRRFSLPDTADAEKINAKSHNGVLTIHIPKHEKLQARKINVEH